jgi:hypothetical protein
MSARSHTHTRAHTRTLTFAHARTLTHALLRSAALLQLLCAYADRYNALLEGRCEDMSLSELHGGARIRWGACMRGTYKRGPW